MSTVEVGIPRGHGPTGPPEGGSLSSMGGMGGRTPPATPKKGGGKMLAVKILMLDDTYTLFQIQSKALGAVLLEQTCRQLNLLESDYFGLEYTDGNTRYWLDLDKPMNRQVCLSQVEPVLRFCVKFYTPDPAQLEEEYTRYLFALQIKRDLSHGELHCNENTAALMASYIVQAECGDYVEEDYPDHRYLSLFKFVPTQDDEMERKIMENHKKHIGMTPAAADLNLLETARRCELYGIKMHPAKDHENVLLNLAAAHMGILVFQNYTKINTFSWAKIRKISFKRKRFLIKLHPEGYGYYKDVVEFFFDGRNECKNFWKKCVEHHGFFRCSTVKKLPRQKTRVLSRGSSFRYSGRTQKQVQDFVRDNYIKRQPFQRKSCFARSQSFRHSPNVHTNVTNVGMSISAQPLIPLRDNQCVGTPVSLSCGSMTLPSRDANSPASATQTGTMDSREYDPREMETPSFTPSGQDTLSPETSIASSPHRPLLDGNFSQQQHLSSKISRRSRHSCHLATSHEIANSSRHLTKTPPHSSSHSILIDTTPMKDFNYIDDIPYVDPTDDSGDNLSHDSYELIEKEIESHFGWKESERDSLSGLGTHQNSSSISYLGSYNVLDNREGLEWCERKGGGDIGVSKRASNHTGSLPRSHGSNTSRPHANGFTGSLPRTHSTSQASNLSHSLAGSRASSRITLEIPIDTNNPPKSDDELSSPGSPEFHENSVCEITSEKGYLLTTRHLGTITITDNSGGSVFSLIKSSRRSVLDDSRIETPSTNLRTRSRSSSYSLLARDSQENLKDLADTSMSMSTMSSRLSASVRAAKQVGQYVDYGSSQESLHKMSSCESDAGSSLSSQTRSSTTPRPMEFHSTKFLTPRRSTSTSPPSITSGSSQLTGPTLPSRPHSMDFSSFHKKSLFHVYSTGRGSDSGGNTDSDICSPLEIPAPIPPERVQEVDEEEDVTPSEERVLFLPPPPDLGLITRIRGSSDEEEEEVKIRVTQVETEEEEEDVRETEEELEEEEENDEDIYDEPHIQIEEVEPHALHPFADEFLELSHQPLISDDDELFVIVDEKQSPFSYDFECLPPPDLKEESPSSGEMDLSVTEVTDTTSRERKVDESDASERTVIEKFRLPDDRLNKVGSKDSQMSIEEIDEGILDRRSSSGYDRRSSQEVGRRSPYVIERRQSYHDLEHFIPQSPRDRRPSSHSHDGDRRSPFLETDRRSSAHDFGRRSPFDRERKISSSSERKGSTSSDRHSSVSSDRRGSSSSDRRGSSSSDRRPSLSDIGRRTSINYEPGQRSPYFDAPVFEFESDKNPDTPSPLPSASNTLRSPISERDHKLMYFDGVVLDNSIMGSDEFTEALIPPEEKIDQFSTSGAKVLAIVEGSPEDVFEDERIDIEVINVEQDTEQLEVEILKLKSKNSPQNKSKIRTPAGIQSLGMDELKILKDDNDKSEENVNADLSDDVFLTDKDMSNIDVDITLEVGRGPKDSINSVSPLPIEEKDNEQRQKKDDLLGAVGGSSVDDEDNDYFYDDDEEDDHAQMSDHSSQSPDLGSEPDEYHDDYHEPEYYQQFGRQVEVGFAFPSRTLSRISERSTTSEQEHEQDHMGLREVEPECSDSKGSTPTEEKLASTNSEEHHAENPSDISTSASDDVHEAVQVSHDIHVISEEKDKGLSVQEKQNVNRFATQLFLRDLPDFIGENSDDEFPSPPSSAFLENPHTELTQIETYYVEMNQRNAAAAAAAAASAVASATAGNNSEGIYDNLPVKFEGIHEVSESESASDDNHTLQEPPNGDPETEEEQNIDDIEKDSTIPFSAPESSGCSSAGGTKKNSPSPPPPPPPRILTKIPSIAKSPTPPLTPPTPIASIDSPQIGIVFNQGTEYFSGAILEELPESDSPSLTSSLSPHTENTDWVNI